MSKIAWFFTFLIFNQFVFGETCETCNQEKGIEGDPFRAATGVVKVEKVMKKLVDANVYKKIDVEIHGKYCVEFNNSSNDKTIRPILSSLKDQNFSVVEMFTRPDCLPFKGNIEKTQMPMFFYTAESPDNCVNYPKQLYEFFNKNQNPEAFTQVVNSKNKLGQTFLDYLKLRYNEEKKYLNPEVEKKYMLIFNFVCSKGGEFSFYKNSSCSSSL